MSRGLKILLILWIAHIAIFAVIAPLENILGTDDILASLILSGILVVFEIIFASIIGIWIGVLGIKRAHRGPNSTTRITLMVLSIVLIAGSILISVLSTMFLISADLILY